MKKSYFKKLFATALAVTIAASILPGKAMALNAETTVNENNANVSTLATSDLQRKVIGYFPAWAYTQEIHGYFDAADLQWDSLTHIQYSFGFVDPVTNKMTLGDVDSAINEDFSDHPLYHKGKEVKLDPTLPYKGHFNVMQTMKKQYPNVKLLMSIGGWAGSRGFYTMMDTDAGIETFANSCVDFLRKYNFDGIDIDFEYPSATSKSGNPDDFDVSESRRGTINARYNLMMKKVREKLDAAAKQDNKQYLFSAAVTASSWVLGGVSDNTYATYLDFLSVMSYDFHGGWNQYVENLANIYSDPADTETIQMKMPTLSMDWAYRYYRGVLPPEKILMGIPYYTRGWEKVTGGNGTGLHGTGGSKETPTPATGKYNVWGDPDKNGNIVPAGANPLWHVLNLMDRDPNLKRYWDPVGGVPHVWQDQEKVFLSFEDEQSIDERLKYIKNKNLGGALIWVMNGDYGLNPNYKPGSTNINEGKYTWGDTLTKKLRQGLNAMGECTVTTDAIQGEGAAEVIDVDVIQKIVYDHPNGENSISLKSNGEAVGKGWTLQLDLPKSCVYSGIEGGTFISSEEIGDFVRIKAKASDYSDFIKIKTVLCYSGARNIRINGKIPANVPYSGNYLPVMKGVSDKAIALNSTFNKRAGVTAVDKEDGDLTANIKVPNGVKTSVAGVYRLDYSVSDSAGANVVKTSKITVLPTEYANAKVWQPDIAYANGDIVVYDGTIYKNKSWWCPAGTIPSTTHYDVLLKLPDNTFVDDIIVTIPEDINGDGVVNSLDLSLIAASYNAKVGSSNYSANKDLNKDGVIDIYDLVKVARKI